MNGPILELIVDIKLVSQGTSQHVFNIVQRMNRYTSL